MFFKKQSSFLKSKLEKQKRILSSYVFSYQSHHFFFLW